MTTHRNHLAAGIPAALAACFLAAACSRAEPVIQYQYAQLVYYETADGVEERLTFFVLPDDPDGLEDLDELWLYHDGEGLSWRILRTDWIERREDGKLWIGVYGLAPPSGEKLPAGLYRAVIIDKGGERSERTFGFEIPQTPHYPFPQITVAEGTYTIMTDYPELFFTGYGEDGAYLTTIAVPALTGRIADLPFSSPVTSFSLWANDPERTTAAFTIAHPVK
jgi:hypothetical protein